MNKMKKGYKRTEIGVIPEEWEIVSLKSLCSVPMQNGVFYKPSSKGKGVRLVNVGDLYRTTPIDVENLELFDATDYEKKCFKIENGDLFFTRSSVVPSGIAHCNIYQKIRSECIVFDSHVIRVRPDFRKVDAHFLYRFCLSKVARTYLVAHSKTATMTTIDQGVLGKCQVFLPTKKEQKAIAEVLSDTDNLIQALEKRIAKKRLIKQGAMQKLLTPKDDWDVKKLGEIADVKSGKRLPLGKSLTDKQTPYPYVRILDMNEGGISLKDIKYVPKEVFPSIKNYRIFKNDIYISVAGTLGLVGRIPEVLDGANLTENANKITNIKCNVDYLHIILKSDLIQNKIDAERTLGAQPKLALIRIRNFEIPLPPLGEQTHIATILSDMDSEIEALEKKLAKYQQLKQGLMQNLLTGKIRLI